MKIKTALILVIALLVCHQTQAADSLTEAALTYGKQFLADTPDEVKWDGTPRSYAKAWEQAMGLTNLLSLRYDGSLPHPWINRINKRLMSMRNMPMIKNASPEAEQLRALVDLYAEYAMLYMSGQIKYGDYTPVRHYLPNGQWLAERVRGKPYLETNCSWSSPEECKKSPPLWLQK